MEDNLTKARPPIEPGTDPAPALTPANGRGPFRSGQRHLAGVLERAGQDGPAEYVRGFDVDGVEHEVGKRVRQVETQVRTRPLMSVGLAVLAGFFLGRILRD